MNESDSVTRVRKILDGLSRNLGDGFTVRSILQVLESKNSPLNLKLLAGELRKLMDIHPEQSSSEVTLFERLNAIRKMQQMEPICIEMVRGETVIKDELVRVNKQQTQCGAVENSVESVSRTAVNEDGDASEKNNEEENGCVVCFEGEMTHVAVPCGHLKYCEKCAGLLMSAKGEQRRCSICRLAFTMIIKVF